MTSSAPDDQPLLSEGDVRDLWSNVLDPAAADRRSLWMIFFDGEGRPIQRVIPIDDIPVRPDAELLHGLESVIRGVTAEGPASGVLLALSRPGEPGVSDRDREWAQRLWCSLGRWMSVYPLMLVTAAGVTPVRGTVSTRQGPGRPLSRQDAYGPRRRTRRH